MPLSIWRHIYVILFVGLQLTENSGLVLWLWEQSEKRKAMDEKYDVIVLGTGLKVRYLWQD